MPLSLEYRNSLPLQPASGRSNMRAFCAVALDLRRRGYNEHPGGRRDRLLRPIRAARQSRNFVRDEGAQVHAASGVDPWKAGWRAYALRLRYGYPLGAVRTYQLYRPDEYARAGDYVVDIDHAAYTRFLKRVVDRGEIRRMLDKRQYPGWCADRDLPAAPVWAEWESGTLVHDASPDGAVTAGDLPPVDLFSKPADAYQGFGTARWAYDGRGWVGRDGCRRDAGALLSELAEISRTLPPMRNGGRSYDRYLLMPRLVNHPGIVPLSNGALNTVRIVTYCVPGGPPQFLVGTYKMAVGDAPADNFHFGGMMAPVDPGTGRLGVGVRRVDRVMCPITHHPDTGARIAGHVLPAWHAAVALTLRGQASEPDMPSIGWDVALTPSGPVLLEANFTSAADIMQAGARPLGDTPYPDALVAHVDAFGGLDARRPELP